MALTIDSTSILSSYYSTSSSSSTSSTNNFSSIDENEDGVLDADELNSYVEESGESVDSADLFDSMDTDGDDSISEDEYSDFTSSLEQRLALVQEAQTAMSQATLQIVQSIDGESSSSSSKSAVSASNKIVNLYAENLKTASENAISNLNIDA